MTFVGANADVRVTGEEELPSKANYFIGNDPAKWRTNVPTYAKVRYEDLYPGVDLVYYGSRRQLEHDFIVRAGADPNRIVVEFKGADRLEVDEHGDLVLHTATGAIRQRKPLVYQDVDGVRKEIPGGYVLKNTQHVTFQVEAYDARHPLVIDPVLSYSTYLGGTGLDTGIGIAVDAAGNAYVTGETSSTDFPTPTGAFQTTFGGGAGDAFVTKFDPTGSALVYSTYLGGTGADGGRRVAVDADGNAYVVGGTFSNDFPVTAGAFQTSSGGALDAFVSKLDPTGSVLVYSTYLGGASDDLGEGIAVDALANAYVTGFAGSTNFPTTEGAFQTTCGSCPSFTNAFVTKLDSTGSALVYSTYLGGSGNDDGLGIAVDTEGSAYVTGRAASSNFPTTAGAFQTTFGGGSEDAFVTKLDSTGSALAYSTFLGGAGFDNGSGIAVDGQGNAYITGRTASSNFPTTAGAFQTMSGGAMDAFATKLNPTGSDLVYSTYLGGSGSDEGLGIAVDDQGNAYVAGQTDSDNFPTTVEAFQTSSGGSIDAFVMKLDSTGSVLVYSTYLGGSSDDVGLGIAVDASSSPNAYVTGYTTSTNFPTTAGAFQTTFGGTRDAFVAKISSSADFP